MSTTLSPRLELKETVLWLSETTVWGKRDWFHIHCSFIVIDKREWWDRMSHLKRIDDVLRNWEGWGMIRDMKNRRIILSLFVLWTEIPYAQRFLNQVTTDRIDVILFIVDNRYPFKPNDNCVYRQDPNTLKLECKQLTSIIYPINILRNLAIQMVDTAYYLNMDADIIPSRTIKSIPLNSSQSLSIPSTHRLHSFQQQHCFHHPHLPVHSTLSIHLFWWFLFWRNGERDSSINFTDPSMHAQTTMSSGECLFDNSCEREERMWWIESDWWRVVETESDCSDPSLYSIW